VPCASSDQRAECTDSASRLFQLQPGANTAGFMPGFPLKRIVVGDAQERVEGSRSHRCDQWRYARTFQSLSVAPEEASVDIFFFGSLLPHTYRDMGMFDTITLDPAIRCAECGALQSSHQTKEFECQMSYYRIGSVVPSPCHSGIIRDRFWCSACHDAGRETERLLYLVIWHSVLAAVELDADEAERKLRETDRLDLVGWLADSQREAIHWQGKFRKLMSSLNAWQRHLNEKATPQPEGAKTRLWSRFSSLPDEILNAPDPLVAIIKFHSKESPENEL